MKFTCLSENLLKGLGVVSKAVPTKGSLPVLSNILFTAKDGRLKLSATNLDTAITFYVGASVDEDGSITVPSKLIHEFISHLSPTSVEGVLKDGIFHLQAGKNKSKFNGTDPTDFPELPEIPKKSVFLEVDPKEFASAIASVSFSAATDESRLVLTGILLAFSKKKFVVAAVDGFRLSEKSVDFEGKAEGFSVVIPAKTLVEVARIFSSSDSPLKIHLNKEDNLCAFESGDVVVSTRIVDGEFPDYKKIIPAQSILTAEFASVDLHEAVKLTNVFAKEADSIIKMTFSDKGLIKLVSVSKELGENNSEIEAEVKGDKLEISFNSKYLLDFLNNIKAEKLVFESNGNVAPGVLRIVGDDSYLHVVMPIRVQG